MVFQCINIRQVPWERLKTAASGLGFQHLPQDLANVNAWKTMFDPYNVTSKDRDQPVHLPSIGWALVYAFLDSLEAVEGTCSQQRLWSNCLDAQADMSLRWLYKSYCRFCHALGNIIYRQMDIGMDTQMEKTIKTISHTQRWETSGLVLISGLRTFILSMKF